MINLIFGCAGSGKTRYMTQRINEGVSLGRRTYLLVPEQQVFTAEAMLADMPASSGLCFEIISFSRLCELVFGKFGGLTYTAASGGVRTLLMWKSLRELSPALSNYNRSKPDAALSQLMLATIDELKASSVSAQDVESVLAKTERDDLKDKLSDVSTAMTAFEMNLSRALGEGAQAAENSLERLNEMLSNHNFFEGADVYIDSFTDFTGIQHKIISQIMKQADNVCISVYSRERGHHAPHNVSAVDTIKRLTRSARESGREFDDIVLGGNTRTTSPQLKLLERHIWDFTAKKDKLPEIPPELCGDIEMVSCQNEYDETECAALKILEARKNGMKYSEMAVIMRNPENRSGIINAVFSKYNIPFFISEKTQLAATPASRFILSSLRCISRGYRLDDVLTLLKTGLCGVSDKDADLFEEYCLTWNIQGKTFTEPVWNMNPSGFTVDDSPRVAEILASANKVRGQIISPLEELKIKLRAAGGNVTEMCRALYSYMEARGLSIRLCELAELELENGNVKEAGEILRVYDCIVSSLSTLCAVLSDDSLTSDEFVSALEIMLSGTEIASVPAVSDSVTVGSAATLRVENIKLAIVMELCEGIFPALPKDIGLLCESDKEMLDELGITFKTRRARLMSDELFYVYRAMATPSEKLIVTTYSSSISGGVLNPSTPWRRLITLFDPKIESFSTKTVKSMAKAISHEREAQSIAEIHNELFGSELVETLSPEIIQNALGDSLYLSKSRIQNFVKCPMLFWSKHILDLRPRTVAAVSYAESGTLIHYVLEKLFSEIRTPDGSLRKKSPTEILELTDKWVKNYVDMTNCPQTPALMFAFSKLRNMAYLMANNISEEFAASDFKMYSFEQSINEWGDNALSPFKITLDEVEGSPTVVLGGNADRVDICRIGDETYVRIIDYKTGNVSFSEENVVSGADLQLPAYLFAVASDDNRAKLAGDGKLIAGASTYVSAVESSGDIEIARSGMILNTPEFLSACNKDLDYSYISTAARKASEKDKLDSCSELFSEERIQQMKQILTDTVKETSTRIYSGEINRTPSADSCKYCPVRTSCPVACKSKY